MRARMTVLNFGLSCATQPQWGAIEKTCGTYDFSAYDTLLSEMQAAGVRPYWILDYSNPCYGPDHGCDTDPCITAYGRLAAAAAAHFKGNGIIWESTNEPNGMGAENATNIAELCAAAGEAFRAAGEFFVGPAVAGMDFGYLNASFAAGLLGSVSGVSVHPYRR
jgi:polysaccharide biosynthesis protein PslG